MTELSTCTETELWPTKLRIFTAFYRGNLLIPGPQVPFEEGFRKGRRKGIHRSLCDTIPPRRSFKKLLLSLSVCPVFMKSGNIKKKKQHSLAEKNVVFALPFPDSF